jgi:hypothetical protein
VVFILYVGGLRERAENVDPYNDKIRGTTSLQSMGDEYSYPIMPFSPKPIEEFVPSFGVKGRREFIEDKGLCRFPCKERT